MRGRGVLAVSGMGLARLSLAVFVTVPHSRLARSGCRAGRRGPSRGDEPCGAGRGFGDIRRRRTAWGNVSVSRG